MKPSGELFLERKQSRRLGVHVRESTRRARGRGRAYPPGRALHPQGPHVAPPTYSFLLYIPTYPQTTRYGAKNLIPPPQPSVPLRSHLGACSGAPPEGASITEGFYIKTMASPMTEGFSLFGSQYNVLPLSRGDLFDVIFFCGVFVEIR